jgi:phage gp16-like protein
MTCRRAVDQRQAELAKIHIAKKELGLDDDTYRDMLWTVARVRSAGDLDAGGRLAVLEHLRARGFKGRRRGTYPGRPHNIDSEDRGPLLRKIEALLAEARRPWSYGDGIARRMFRIDRLAMCNPEQLSKVVAALSYDAARHGRRTR